MPDSVIARVEEMAEAANQPLMGRSGPVFEWSPGILIEDEEMDEEINDQEEADEPHEEVPVILEEAEPAQQVVPEHQEEEELPLYDEVADDEEAFPIPEQEPMHVVETVAEDEQEVADNQTDEDATDEGGDGGHTVKSETPSDDEGANPDRGRYNLRADRTRSYDHRFGHETQFLQYSSEDVSPLRQAVAEMKLTECTEGVHKVVTGILMNQMTAKAGIKKHGQVAIDALHQEFLQLHDLGVFEGHHAHELSKSQKRGALRAISVIKEKRSGKIKGRTVADGSVQRGLYSKEETSSPTVSTDALMLSLMIDAAEHRDVATADVAGAYLHAKLDDFTLLKVEGQSVDIMCDVNEMYEKYVTIEHGKRVLYLQLLKALYGCVKSALLWYELFMGTLKEMGFELNPYDMCVANKMFDGKQCTIAWFVDDNKISHVDHKVVTEVILKIEKRFGKMTVTRGKEHIFLGMHIVFNDDGTVSIQMKEYIEEAIADFLRKTSKTAVTPANRNLFEINHDCVELTMEESDNFHSIVAKLLYVSKRARIDIELPIAFLCTRVSCSTEQDQGKLARVLEYLSGSLDDWLILGADDIACMSNWVDSSYAVHEDMKSHTGGATSFGRGAVMSKSAKQKLNTKSSTEAEFVGGSDYIPRPIWAKKFLECQGYVMKENIFYQDNMSTIQFLKNGRKSCGPNSRHIDIRYFFIKDRLEIENMEVRYCPTEQMLADFFTKPLQGNLFRRLKAVIMGHAHIDTLKLIPTGPPQERVGESVNGCGPDVPTVPSPTVQPHDGTGDTVGVKGPSPVPQSTEATGIRKEVSWNVPEPTKSYVTARKDKEKNRHNMATYAAITRRNLPQGNRE